MLLRRSQQWFDSGLEVVPLQVEIRPGELTARQPHSGTGSRGEIIIAGLSRADHVTAIRRAWRAQDHDAIGELLGYPICCRLFFQEFCVRQKFIDTTWAMAMNGPLTGERSAQTSGPIGTNIFLQSIGIRPVPHLPCSFGCEESVHVAASFKSAAQQAGYEQEVVWCEQILGWPVEWSSLHGIAEVKTPILKISTRSESTANKYLIRRVTANYPAEGARGLNFPYQTMGTKVPSETRSFRLGLANPILPIFQEPQLPEWYHRDNGFSSQHRMDLLHSPIVLLARKVLAGYPGNVIDLGCGNGALLSKICQGKSGLVPFGIDCNAGALEHSRTLHPSIPGNFIEGDFTDPAAWSSERRYELGILMIGRVMEIPLSRANLLLSAIRDRCRQLLVYVYPDWSTKPFGELVQSVGLRLTATQGDHAGLANVNGNNHPDLRRHWRAEHPGAIIF
ncbi:MAG TPA: class I SAM-dependent methyltransferase [Terriglobales bacterium]|nr:class I SAM-dependent methyltransferase [Terriglobales bacterium]